MIQLHSSTTQQRAQWVSILVAQEGSYGVVSQLGKEAEVSRQTLYSWKAKGREALQAAFEPPEPQATIPLERAVLTLLVEGHASYRGIQTCLAVLLGQQVSLGTITAIVQEAGERAQRWLGQQGDVWHVLHLAGQGQARLERVVQEEEERGRLIERQEQQRASTGKKPVGRPAKTTGSEQEQRLRQVHRVLEGAEYLFAQLHQ